MLIQCDDKIELIADKTRSDGSGTKIGLAPEWRQYSNIAYDSKTGEAVITGYWNQKTGENTSAAKVNLMSDEERRDWTPCFEREIPTGIPNTHTRLRDNHIFIRISKLSYSDEELLFASRYRRLLEVLHGIRPNILTYNSKGGNERSFFESSRNKLNRWFRLYEYEFNILFIDEELGRKVFNELKESSVKVYENETLYLKGYGKKQGNTTIKMYDMKHHSAEAEGVFKLELTFRRNTFSRLGIDITDMTRQENCIEYLRHEAIREIMKLKGGEAVEQLQFNFVAKNNILSRIIKLENDLKRNSQRTEQRFDITEQRFAGIENELKELENELKELRRALVKQ